MRRKSTFEKIADEDTRRHLITWAKRKHTDSAEYAVDLAQETLIRAGMKYENDFKPDLTFVGSEAEWLAQQKTEFVRWARKIMSFIEIEKYRETQADRRGGGQVEVVSFEDLPVDCGACDDYPCLLDPDEEEEQGVKFPFFMSLPKFEKKVASWLIEGLTPAEISVELETPLSEINAAVETLRNMYLRFHDLAALEVV